MSATMVRPSPVPPGPDTRRRRWLSLAVPALVLALVVAWVGWRTFDVPEPHPGYEAWTDGPTRGSLAGDDALRAAVEAAWADPANLPVDDVVTHRLLEEPYSDPHVAWMGLAAGAPAAVVYQPVELTRERFGDEDLYGSAPGWVFGFLRADADGVMRIGSVSVDWGARSAFPWGGWSSASAVSPVLGGWASVDDGVALLLDLGQPVDYSTAPATPDSFGRYTTPFAPVDFVDDGVAVLLADTVTPGADLVVRAANGDGAHGLVGSPGPVKLGPKLLFQPRLVPIDGLSPSRAPGNRVVPNYFLGVINDGTRSYGGGGWTLTGRSAGEELAVTGFAIDGAWRVGLALGAEPELRLFDAGAVRAGALPVAVRLPDAAGWIVAGPDRAIAYRAPGSGRWVAAGDDAVLLPDSETWQLRLTDSAGGSEVVTVTPPDLIALEPVRQS